MIVKPQNIYIEHTHVHESECPCTELQHCTVTSRFQAHKMNMKYILMFTVNSIPSMPF